MGEHDLPAMINGILNFLPSYKDLTYVGFQEGNT